MEVIIKKTAEELGEIAADVIAEVFVAKPNGVIGLATGSSPLPIYEALGRRIKDGVVSLRQVKGYQLDEYVGLPADHPETYRNFIERFFVAATDIDTNNVHGPNGLADDLGQACVEYDQAITDAGGIDIQILGIGVDGHIAFNEPGTSLGSLTHPEILTNQTRSDNARFFDDDINQVPTHALTQGVGTILRSRRALLIATGANKADAVKALVEGPVTSMCTGSALQLHPNVKILLDEAAASKLDNIDFYQEIQDAKLAGLTWSGK